MRTIFVIIAAVLLIVVGIIIFGGGSNNKKAPNPSQALPSYSDTDAQVQMITDGQVNGDDLHRQIRITIGRGTRKIDIIQGYQGHVIFTKSFSNNEDAYNIFLQAIYGANFTKSRKTNIIYEYSVCALGQHYTYNLINTGSNSTNLSLWTTSCGANGTSAANTPLLQSLFNNQIPDYDTITGDVQL